MLEITKQQFLSFDNVNRARILKYIVLGIIKYVGWSQMNKNIKKTVYKILKQDKLAREDDWYLIQQVLIELLPCTQEQHLDKYYKGWRLKE